MPVDLKALARSLPAPVVKIDVSDIVAKPGFAPRAYQATAPLDAWGTYKLPVGDSPDLRRVVALPRRPRPDDVRSEALIELMSERFGRHNPNCQCATLAPNRNPPCIKRLRTTQAWALYEIGLRGGLLGPIGVGHGKTILDLLTPLAMRDCKLALLLVPPGLVSQLVAEYHLFGQHFRTPSMIVYGGKGQRYVKPGEPVLHVFPYSRLQRPEATSFLEDLQPDTIIADEVHKLRHADTATTGRVLRYFENHPETRFCGWSGSITDSSPRDYGHLSALALREGSPLPLDPEITADWSRALEPSPYPAPAGALYDLCEPGEHVYQGFHRRLVETIGVVTTTESAIDALLEIYERPAPAIPAELVEAMDMVRDTWMRPDGEELVDALQVARALRELACGFFYRWIFPRGEAEHVIHEWLEARKEWRRELRVMLRDRREHLDSPKLCALAAMRAWGQIPHKDPTLPAWKSECWPRWYRAKGTVQPETEAVRLDDYLARDAAEWGAQHRGVIWYEHRAFGEWVAEISGMPLHGGGPKAGELIGREKGDRSIVASIKSHGTGRDGLQRIFREQLVANPPSSATAWEQMLGRLHRIGQESKSVRAEFYRHTPELKEHVDQALRRAFYVQGTLGANQKLRTGWKIDAD